ncbi:MAG TPA: PIG-L family deacetylase [Acidimicrobiales bacterium]|nr:PIG-L family deacetylase [Acidimicrobiales bacterium]
MSPLPTLVCVHAHPDDEAFFGAGASAHYAALGHRVVLITCTNGQLGIDPAGRAGSETSHDSLQTKIVRAGELQRAAALLGFSRVVTLGFEDSGMKGWADNDQPNAFMNVDVDAVARTIASIFDEEHASVVVTYDESGFYGHPDHVQANVVTRRALDFSSSVQRLYYPVVPRGVITAFVAGAKELELSMPAWVLDAGTNVPDELVATTMDVRAYARLKQEAMATHASQIDNGDLVRMNEELFTLLFGTEYYQRAWSRFEATDDDADLFGGL